MNPISRYRFLIIAISFSIAVHAVSLLAMVLLLEPGLDTQASVLERARYVADNPWL
ncbi:MAG: hypothetical protein JKY56_27535 [Kofleriaceae bacterium]|nr:hypothetical protein [Kofleriaceae bacterium]